MSLNSIKNKMYLKNSQLVRRALSYDHTMAKQWDCTDRSCILHHTGAGCWPGWGLFTDISRSITASHGYDGGLNIGMCRPRYLCYCCSLPSIPVSLQSLPGCCHRNILWVRGDVNARACKWQYSFKNKLIFSSPVHRGQCIGDGQWHQKKFRQSRQSCSSCW